MKNSLTKNTTKQTSDCIKVPPRAYLREWRNYKGMTLQEVGDKVGVHRSQISNWETGGRKLNEEKLILFCDAIGINLMQIYNLPNFESIDALLEKAKATPAQKLKVIKTVKLWLDIE